MFARDFKPFPKASATFADGAATAEHLPDEHRR
jgi:hypothetical protein